MTEFKQPDGVIDVRIDKATNRLSTPACPDAYAVAFIAGRSRGSLREQQKHHAEDIWLHCARPARCVAGSCDLARSVTGRAATESAAWHSCAESQPPKEEKKKKGFFGKIGGLFKGDDKDKDKSQSQNQ